ncbi:MAG: hypothetical protein EU548_04305 [Promethearchaeota archaeon]|nr:MAG: hypothetical protein EU548_04305 [Candidatus Lokiarchaeota archaeon]
MKEKFVISIILPIITNIFSFFASYLLALHLQVQLMEEWLFINSVISLGFLFSDLGLNSIHYQYASKDRFEKYFGSFFLLKIILIFSNLTSTFLFISILKLWNTKFLPYLLIILLTYVIIHLSEAFVRNLKSKKKIFKCEIPKFLAINGNNIAIIFLALNLAEILNPLLILSLLNFGSNLFFLILLLFLSKKDLVVSEPKKYIVFEYLKDAKPLILYSILYIITENIGNIILFYSGRQNALAYFGIIYNYIIITLLLISRSITDIYQIEYAHYFKNEDINSIQYLAHKIEKYFSIIFLLIITITLINGDLLFSIFLPEYIDSLPILYILIFVPYLSGISLPYSKQMVPGRKQKGQAIFDTFIRLLRLILLIFLIPNQIIFINGLGLGTIGYSIAILVPWIIFAIGYRILINKFFNIPSQKNLLTHIFLTIIDISLVVILRNYFLENIIHNDFVLLLLLIILSVLLFALSFIISKQLTREDFKFFLKLLKLKNYSKAFREEFNDE